MTKRLGSMMLLLTLLACGTVSDTTSGTSVLDGEWRLVTGVDADGRFKPAPGAPITMTIDGEVMSGSAGCNSYDGSIQIDGSSVTSRSGAMTEIGCSGRVGENEGRYINALEAATSIRQEGGELTLSGRDIELGFHRATVVPTSSLAETDWLLEGLIEGRGDEGMVSSTLPGSIVFHDDGAFEGDTGCRDLEGRWEESGGNVEVSDFATSGERCNPREQDQHEHIVSVLESGFTYQIVENSLTLSGARGALGLTYAAP